MDGQLNSLKETMSEPKQSHQQTKQEVKEKEIMREEDEEIPEHFYDSDMASVNENDFLSDNEPPKDIVYERKLLHKQKMLHIFKTIVKVGKGIDKPAPYDQIILRFKEEKINKDQQEYQAKDPAYLDEEPFLTYNLGLKNPQIERLVTSMKVGEAAMFQLEELQVSKKTNIKVLKNKTVFQIEVQSWITVIDIDSDLKFLKYMRNRGEGPHRVAKFDEVSFKAVISVNDVTVFSQAYKDFRIEEEELNELPQVVWKILSSMKKKQIGEVSISNQNMKEALQFQPEMYMKFLDSYKKEGKEIQEDLVWKVYVEVMEIIKVDDIYMDGTILKKTLMRGVSTAKPQSASFIYYALKFLGPKKMILHEDKCFNSDWWEDYGKLEELGCRKNYLDEYKLSKFLKASMKRMKPAEIAQIQCRDLSLFKYGQDYEELKSLWPQDQEFPPKKVFMVVRVYNFVQGMNCFNMTLEQKIIESRRKKVVAVQLLSQGDIKKAFKRFQNIVSFYSSGEINQEAYDEKVSALMNSLLCLMKQNKFSEMLPLCQIILEEPKHGFDQNKMKIKGPQGLKVEGKVENAEEDFDERLAADLSQNQKIIEKCLYRKALALLRVGESKESLICLQKIDNKNEEVLKLKEEAQKHLQKYQQKSKKLFKNMFS